MKRYIQGNGILARTCACSTALTANLHYTQQSTAHECRVVQKQPGASETSSHEIVKYALLLDLNPTMNSLAVAPLLIPPPPALQ